MKQAILLLFLLGVFFGYSYADSTRQNSLSKLSDLSVDASPDYLNDFQAKSIPKLSNGSSRRPTSRGPASVSNIQDPELLDLEEENSIGKDHW